MNALVNIAILVFIHPLVFLIKRTPRSWVQPMISILYYLSYPFLSKERAQGRKNLRQILKIYLKKEQDDFLKKCLQHQLSIFIEAIIMTHRPEDFNIEGSAGFQSFLKDYKQVDRPMVGISGHLGNWEILTYEIGQVFPNLSVAIAKPTKFDSLNKLAQDIRSVYNMEVLWTTKDNPMKKILKKITQDSLVVGFIMDQKSKGRRGPKVNFFGHQTDFVRGPANIAMKTQSRIFSVYCYRVQAFNYKLEWSAIQYTDDTNVFDLTQKLASSIEEAIKVEPTQWPWNYRRWRN